LEGCFLAVDLCLRLGLVEEIKGDPYSVEVVPDSLAGVLSAEESMSSIRIGSYLEDFTNLGLLGEVIQKDFLIGLAEGFVVDCLGREGELEGLYCMARNFRIRGKSVRLAVVLTLFFLIPSSG